MTKPKIKTVLKSDNHLVFSLNKEQSIFPTIRALLNDLHIESSVFVDGFGKPAGDDAEPDVMAKDEDVEDKIDEHYTWNKGNLTIDLIFGESKIFLIFALANSIQEKISELMIKHFEF